MRYEPLQPPSLQTANEGHAQMAEMHDKCLWISTLVQHAQVHQDLLDDSRSRSEEDQSKEEKVLMLQSKGILVLDHSKEIETDATSIACLASGLRKDAREYFPATFAVYQDSETKSDGSDTSAFPINPWDRTKQSAKACVVEAFCAGHLARTADVNDGFEGKQRLDATNNVVFLVLDMKRHMDGLDKLFLRTTAKAQIAVGQDNMAGEVRKARKRKPDSMFIPKKNSKKIKKE